MCLTTLEEKVAAWLFHEVNVGLPICIRPSLALTFWIRSCYPFSYLNKWFTVEKTQIELTCLQQRSPKRQQPLRRQIDMNMMIKLRCSLRHAARALHQNAPDGTRLVSTAASKANPEQPLTPEQIYAREDKYGAHNYHPLPVALEKGKGELFLSPEMSYYFQWSHHPLFPRYLFMGCGRHQVLWLPECLQRREPGPLSPKDHICPQRSGLQAHADIPSVLQQCAGSLRGVHHRPLWLR